VPRKGIFWNGDEKRLRSFWRLTIQGVAWVALVVILQAIIETIAILIAVAEGTISQEMLSNLTILERLLLRSPLVVLGLKFSELLVTLGTVWLAGRLLDRRRFVDFGFRFDKNWWIDLGFGLFLGAFSFALIFAVERAAGWLTVTGTFVTRNPSVPFPITILLPLLIFIMVGIEEELFSRGYQLTNLAEGLNWKRIGPRGAIVLATVGSSVFFGLLHGINPNATLVSTLNLMVAGLALATGYVLTGELAIPIGYHIAWNFFQGNVFGFQVSGMDFRSATFIAIRQGGPELWTGGAFGPEAGLLGLGMDVLGIALIVLWVWLRYRRFGLHAPIAEPPDRPA